MNVLKSIKHNIKLIKEQAVHPKAEYRLFLWFIIGVLAGSLIINMFCRNYRGDINIYNSYIYGHSNTINENINKWSYMLYCMGNYIKEFMIILLLNFTPFGNVFNRVFLCIKGILIGILVSANTLTYGAGGILLYIVSIFPHYIVYVPFVISSIYVSIKMSERVKEKDKKISIKAIFIVFILAFLTSVLEAFANYSILQLIYK